MSSVYSILHFLGFLLSSPYWLVRMLAGTGYSKVFRTRFLGPGKLLPKTPGVPRVWVWALSLVEVLSARELVKSLKGMGLEVAVSSTTTAGLSMARSLWPSDPVVPSPFDFALSARRYLAQISPDFIILVETDVWPGFLAEVGKKGLRASLVSARLSPRSYGKLRLVRGFWKRVLRSFDTIAVQSGEDLKKFLDLGADPQKIKVTGNLKFDENPGPGGENLREELLRDTGWPPGDYVVAGSIHPGEDSLLIAIFQGLFEAFPNLRLVIAPRDKPKFEGVWRKIREAFPDSSARRSEPRDSDKNARAFLLDSLGELSKFYALGSLAIIGKSFPGRHEGGGHNPLEAAAQGSAVVSGPLVHNFKSMYKALQDAGGALVVPKEELPMTLASLVSNPEKIREMGGKGLEFVLSHRGAVGRTLEFIKPPRAVP